MNRKELGLFCNLKFWTSILSAEICIVSRVVFPEKMAQILNGNYNRSLLEHGVEAFGFVLLILSWIEAMNQLGLKSPISEKIVLVQAILYYLFLFQIPSEISQAVGYNRALQWEQILASVVGIGSGLLAIAIINRLSKS